MERSIRGGGFSFALFRVQVNISNCIVLCAIPTWSFLYSLLYRPSGCGQEQTKSKWKKITAAARQRRREKRKSSSAIFLFLFSFFSFFDSWGFSALTRKRKGKEEEVFDVKYLILAEKDVKVTERLFHFFFLFFFTFVEINTKSKNWQWNFVLFILFFFICGRSRSYFFLLFFCDSTFWRLADFSAHETLPSCDRIVFSPEIKWIWFFLYRCKNKKKDFFCCCCCPWERRNSASSTSVSSRWDTETTTTRTWNKYIEKREKYKRKCFSFSFFFFSYLWKKRRVEYGI